MCNFHGNPFHGSVPVKWNSIAYVLKHVFLFALIYLIHYLNHIMINPLSAKFFRGNINIYLHFISLLHIDMTQVVGIFPRVRQRPTYST